MGVFLSEMTQGLFFRQFVWRKTKINADFVFLCKLGSSAIYALTEILSTQFIVSTLFAGIEAES